MMMGYLTRRLLTEKLSEALEEVELPEVSSLNEYILTFKKKDKLAFIAAHDEISWENVTAGKDGTYGKAAANALIGHYRANFDFPENSYEAHSDKD